MARVLNALGTLHRCSIAICFDMIDTQEELFIAATYPTRKANIDGSSIHCLFAYATQMDRKVRNIENKKYWAESMS
ncbi:MAG: hypothetical protein OXU23_13040 [Candidatus Poribacteria bacterium]|nr:hypothetical protein [Candidatus Poribacteria bacterium]